MMIDLSDNLLEGRIPRSLGNCTRLEFLALRNNQLDGAFFFIFVGSSFKVEKFLSYFNNLNGAISEPTSHLGFPDLLIIDLSHNKFTGKLPSKYFKVWKLE